MALAASGVPALTKGATPEPTMNMLGKTGLHVSAIGLGATRTMEPSIIETALHAGMNFIDTGRHYHNGQNEEMVGKVLQAFSDRVIVQSKLRVNIDPDKADDDTDRQIRQQMRSSMQASLKALRMETIDIMLLHNQSELGLIDHETVMSEFARAKEKGWIRFCGFSCHSNQANMARWVNANGFYDVVMIAYNHQGAYTHSRGERSNYWDQDELEKELQIAHQNGIGVVAMKTASGGRLAAEGEEPSMARALEWIAERPFIHTTATAMVNFDQIEENQIALKGEQNG